MLNWISKKLMDYQISEIKNESDFKGINLSYASRKRLDEKAGLVLIIGFAITTAAAIFCLMDSIYKKGFNLTGQDYMGALLMYPFMMFCTLFFPGRKAILKEYQNTLHDENSKNQYALRKIEEKRHLEMEERRKINEEEQRIENARRKRLQDIEDEEAAKSRGKAKGLSELYKTQIELMIKYKREGVNIENDIYEMRKRLLSLEREENNAMVQDLLGTLDRL
jgi:hypothetical protein